MTELPAEIRQRLQVDFHRPRYHFLPPSNWMNDPNGLIQWKGQYHLFYQYNPSGPLWGNIHWGHTISDDLIHWRDLPIALAPTPGGPDETGVFSGCAVAYEGQPVIIYTGTRGTRHEIQTQCVATGTDDGLVWQKHAQNPVIHQVPPEAGQTSDFRDPFVWHEADGWYMVLGSRIKDQGGVIFLYRSNDLINWTYLGPLFTGDRRHGVIWECPNFFKLDDRWVLIISSHLGTATGTVLYFVGTYENHRFTPTSEGVLDFGTLYAPLSFVDDQQRRVLIGWLREARSNGEQERAGWSGVQSIPRLLSLDDAGRLHMAPVPELETIRGAHRHWEGIALQGQITLDAQGQALDIAATFSPQANGSCGLALLAAGDQPERIEIIYQAATGQLIVRKVVAEFGHSQSIDSRVVPHTLQPDEPLRLRILLDGSVVEIIANERTSLSSRLYPTQITHNQVHLLGEATTLNSLDIWEMPSIWQ
ncbi:MAG: glycoside hydrolase family 32 protein [Anaerolineae bacterium]|nr:glycoside hydrolase family 32 protein [Anaerolineae bacterium]